MSTADIEQVLTYKMLNWKPLLLNTEVQTENIAALWTLL